MFHDRGNIVDTSTVDQHRHHMLCDKKSKHSEHKGQVSSEAGTSLMLKPADPLTAIPILSASTQKDEDKLEGRAILFTTGSKSVAGNNVL